MKRKKKKSIKMRGKRTFGYGSHKKHRGGGSRGGRGMAGTKKQKKTWMMKYKPGHLGKRGFKSLKQRKLGPGKKAVNVRDLERLAREIDGLDKSKKAVKPSGGKKEIDISKLGYSRVLGKGSVGVALTVKADYFTETARQKIEQAGGKAVALVKTSEGAENPEKQDSS